MICFIYILSNNGILSISTQKNVSPQINKIVEMVLAFKNKLEYNLRKYFEPKLKLYIL